MRGAETDRNKEKALTMKALKMQEAQDFKRQDSELPRGRETEFVVRGVTLKAIETNSTLIITANGDETSE